MAGGGSRCGKNGQKPGWLWFDWTDGAVMIRRQAEDGNRYWYRTIVYLWPFWCFNCGAFTLGCSEHWFCSLCRRCEAYYAAEAAADRGEEGLDG